jgi:hypothetical protein
MDTWLANLFAGHDLRAAKWSPQAGNGRGLAAFCRTAAAGTFLWAESVGKDEVKVSVGNSLTNKCLAICLESGEKCWRRLAKNYVVDKTLNIPAHFHPTCLPLPICSNLHKNTPFFCRMLLLNWKIIGNTLGICLHQAQIFVLFLYSFCLKNLCFSYVLFLLICFLLPTHILSHNFVAYYL